MKPSGQNQRPDSAHECIDPAVGRCLWELEISETAPDRRAVLQAHLDLCDACRLDRAVAARLATGLADGTLHLPPAPAAGNRRLRPEPRTLITAGSVLIAASLALLMILPPAPTGDPVHLRGIGPAPGVLRPVEGEVVHPASLVLSWRPVSGATGYRVVLHGLNAEFHWEGVANHPELKVPARDLGPAARELRAVITPVPRDLVPTGRLSVTFRTGNRFDVAFDRLKKAPLWVNLMWSGGLLVMAIGIWITTRRIRDHI